ncbi:hypothetical protein NDU88_001626 [Pleurodeles waltl]|uniref:Uncharacterized protein n=1 Tax=Pleurodeles waltl TaxID=8319 RepID=A0AAV7SZQ8_PLEWA|nr:hypothetical protein NDU88_001626 [Pleurodeles waltl]
MPRQGTRSWAPSGLQTGLPSAPRASRPLKGLRRLLGPRAPRLREVTRWQPAVRATSVAVVSRSLQRCPWVAVWMQRNFIRISKLVLKYNPYCFVVWPERSLRKKNNCPFGFRAVLFAKS